MNDPLLDRLKAYGGDLDRAADRAEAGASVDTALRATRRRRVLPVMIAAVCVGIVVTVLVTNHPPGPRIETADTTQPSTTTLTSTATAQVTAHFEFSSPEVVAGGILDGWLVIDNNTGADIDIRDGGCAPKWGARLTNATVPPSAAFTLECNVDPAGTTLLPGTTRLAVALSAIYSECTRDPIPTDAPMLACLPSPADPMPPLPAGDYEAVFVGALPGVPTPAPVAIRVLEPPTPATATT